MAPFGWLLALFRLDVRAPKVHCLVDVRDGPGLDFVIFAYILLANRGRTGPLQSVVGGGGDRSGRWQYSLVLRLGRVGGHGRTARCERGGAKFEVK